MPDDDVHLMRTGQRTSVCCNKTPFELLGDRITYRPYLVNCGGVMRRFELDIPAPMWMYVDKAILDLYAREMWLAIVRQAGWVPEDDPDIMHAPHPLKFDVIKVSGLARPAVVPATPRETASSYFRQREEQSIVYRDELDRQLEQILQAFGVPSQFVQSDAFWEDDDESWSDASSNDCRPEISNG